MCRNALKYNAARSRIHKLAGQLLRRGKRALKLWAQQSLPRDMLLAAYAQMEQEKLQAAAAAKAPQSTAAAAATAGAAAAAGGAAAAANVGKPQIEPGAGALTDAMTDLDELDEASSDVSSFSDTQSEGEREPEELFCERISAATKRRKSTRPPPPTDGKPVPPPALNPDWKRYRRGKASLKTEDELH